VLSPAGAKEKHLALAIHSLCRSALPGAALRPNGLHLRSIAFAFPCTTLHSQVAAAQHYHAPHTGPKGLRLCSSAFARQA